MLYEDALNLFNPTHRNSLPSWNQRQWDTFSTLAKKHLLLGYLPALSHFDQFPTELQWQAKKANMAQRIWNSMILDEFKNLARVLRAEGVRFGVLKGGSLLGRVYPDPGQKYLCDIDLWIEPAAAERTHRIMEGLGYHLVSEKKWEANSHKSNWTQISPSGISIDFELHTEILWPKPSPLLLEWTFHPDGYPILTPELEWFHLVTHHLEQHTLTRLAWLVELVLWYQVHRKSLNWEKAYHYFHEQNRKKLFNISLWLLQRYFGLDLPEGINTIQSSVFWRNTFTPALFWKSRRSPIRYYLAKHFLRDRFRESIRYDFLWLKNLVADDVVFDDNSRHRN